MDDQSDQWLIERAVGGDSAAFARLIDDYYELIYRVAYKWCANQADAEDVTHDVCVKLGHSMRSFKGTSSFASWLYRVTLNAVRDLHRARNRQLHHASALALISDSEYRPDPEGDLTKGQLWSAVDALPEKYRDAVLLVYSEGLSHSEAAEIIGCAEKTVSWHIHEAKKQLKATLEC